MTQLLYFARAAAELSGSDIQIFPPGDQVVTPSPADGSEAKEMTLVIDEETAAILEAARASYQAKADSGEGDAPYLDFNHDDREAAAWPKRIFWAGSDPNTGGVRAEVEWSSAGDEAVKGKTFRRFSPAFYAKDGRVTGAPINMGGLVNRAAFTRIQPLFAKQPEALPEPNDIMTPEQIAALQAENATLKTTVTELEGKVGEFTATLQAHAKADAEATVALAAKEGRIAAAPEVQTKWVGALLSNPESKELLLAMAPNPALVTVVKAKSADQVIVEDAVALLAKFEALPRDEQPAFFRANKAALCSLKR